MNLRNHNRKWVNEYCFLAFVVIFSFLKALGFYEGQAAFTMGMILAFSFWAVSFAGTKKTIGEWLLSLSLLLMGLAVYHNTGEKSLLVNCAFLVGMKASSEKRIMRTGLCCWGAGYIILTFLSLTGLHPDTIFMHNKHGIGYVVCHSLGYAHSNVLHINYLCICAMILFLAKDALTKRQKIVLTILLAALDLYVFLYSMSFTGLAASVLFYLVYLYGLFRSHFSRAEGIFAQMVLPLCLCFSLAGPVLIKGELFELLNNALNTRYMLTRYFLLEQPLTLFGSRLVVPYENFTLDCSYAYLLSSLGIIPFCFFMMLYFGTMHRLVKEQKMTETAIMIGFFIAGVTEPFLFNLSFKNITFVFVGRYLFKLTERKTSRITTDKTENHLFSFRTVVRQEAPQKMIFDYVITGLRQLFVIWCIHWKTVLLTAVLSSVVVSGLFCALTKPVEAVYVNNSVNEEKERTFSYLTTEEVSLLNDGGNIVYGYSGPDEKMYSYTGTTANVEYARRAVSWGVWTAAFLCIAEGIFFLNKPGKRHGLPQK